MNAWGPRTSAAEIAETVDFRGKVAVVTGASSGLGAETLRALVSAGATVVAGARSLAAVEALAIEANAERADAVVAQSLDLSDLASVARFADVVLGRFPVIDLLIANAGVSKTPDSHLPNGLDVRFATNHLGHFLLASRLRGALANRGGRIVVVSSAAHKGRPIRLDDLQRHLRGRDDFAAYGESKTANILFCVEATRRWGPMGVFANAVLPGSALTGLQRHHGDELMRTIGFIQADGTPNPILKTPGQAAATSVWAATAPELEGRGGLVLEDCGLAMPAGPDMHPWCGFDPAVIDPQTAEGLWATSESLLADAGYAIAGPGLAGSDLD